MAHGLIMSDFAGGLLVHCWTTRVLFGFAGGLVAWMQRPFGSIGPSTHWAVVSMLFGRIGATPSMIIPAGCLTARMGIADPYSINIEIQLLGGSDRARRRKMNFE